ncbi:MAG: MmcQ/YjbR family DNA-binding protein [Cytophagales bacterium]|nr:MmcQ/YjbR family DNA-binding protein [Cytophagales bacterium]
MNIEAYRNYCLRKKGVTEEFPFDENTLVYKVKGKMFTATAVDEFKSINVKCDPAKAVQLRETYPGVLPGYHMNKKHWNTILMDGSMPDQLVYQWIDDSYKLVVAQLPKGEQASLKNER